jgi:hypothetical protein
LSTYWNQSPINQNVLRCLTGRIKDEVRPVLPRQFGGVIYQGANLRPNPHI